jgi:AcrR family transcriptional regulator
MTRSRLPSDEPEEDGRTWREQAVSRSLDTARVRAEVRVQRFLDAATELFASSPGKEFTVQEVVERSGQSLRSFYQYFGGKHDLLLALFEESVQSTARELKERLAGNDDPLERLRCFVVEYYRLCRATSREVEASPSGRTPFMTEFAQQLLTSHPKEAARVFAPVVTLFEGALHDAAAAGAIRAGVSDGPIVGIVLEAIMFNAFSSTIGGLSARPHAGDSAEYLWSFILHGIGSNPAP